MVGEQAPVARGEPAQVSVSISRDNFKVQLKSTSTGHLPFNWILVLPTSARIVRCHRPLAIISFSGTSDHGRSVLTEWTTLRFHTHAVHLGV